MKKNLGLLLILVVLGGIAYFMFSSDKKSTIASNPLSNFSIEDTASVTKIFISDKVTGTALLTKDPSTGNWMINGKYRAKDFSVKILLESFKNITVKGPVPDNMKQMVISNAAGTGKKIEIYTTNSEVPEKIWISAGNTSDHHGDFFILEIPGVGISPEPFVVDMPMFSGYLTARFFTFENDWRYSGVFNYSDLEFNEISVTQNDFPKRNFTINMNGDDLLTVSNPTTGKTISIIDTSRTRDYILQFKKIHLETHDSHLEQPQIDSVLARTPDWTISVKENDGGVRTIDLYHVPGNGKYHNANGEPLRYNQDMLYGSLRNGELVKIQYAAVFKPLMLYYNYFEKTNDGLPLLPS